MKQNKRNNIAVKIGKLLKKEKANIFDCLDILQNLEDAYIRELEFNIENMDGASSPLQKTKKATKQFKEKVHDKDYYNTKEEDTQFEKIEKGCGKEIYIKEKTGNRTSGHNCICGNNKWNYLCDECSLKHKNKRRWLENEEV